MTTPSENELLELRQRIARLRPEKQLLLAEEILAGIRTAHFPDRTAMLSEMREEIAALLTHEQAQRAVTFPFEVRRDAG